MCIAKRYKQWSRRNEDFEIWNEASRGMLAKPRSGAVAKGFLYQEGELGRSVGRANSARDDSWLRTRQSTKHGVIAGCRAGVGNSLISEGAGLPRGDM